MKTENLYDKTSIQSIFAYSKHLIGHSLREIVSEEDISNSHLGKGKGGLGQLIEELFFHYPVNSDTRPDFNEAGIELKATGLREEKAGGLQIKERLVCGMIDYCAVVKEPFESSLFYLKCRIMLLVFYLYEKGADKLDLKFIYTVVWKLPEKDLLVIKHDFETIVGKIKRGEAHNLSEGDTEYLGACRKGQKGDKGRVQPFSEILAPKRAFSLKPSYMRTILMYVKSKCGEEGSVSNMEFPSAHNELTTLEELRHSSLEKIISDRFQPWIGKSVKEIINYFMPSLNVEAKDINYVVCCLIASNGRYSGRGNGHIESSEEFQKSGLRLKTIPSYADGRLKESMSFENINYEELYNNDDWFESTTYELFTSRFLFVEFQHPNILTGSFNGHKGEAVLKKVFYWTMPQSDLMIAEQYWEDIRKHILENEIELEKFWKIKDKKKFHVRPKGTKSSYRNSAVNPNGGTADKYCYWFNKEYVASIIKQFEARQDV